MGTTIVHLILTGIVAIAPAYDGATPLDAWDIVLPTIAHGSGHEPHIAHLMAVTSDSSGGSPEVGSVLLRDGSRVDVNVWALSNTHLSVVGKPGGAHSSTMPNELLKMSAACKTKECRQLRQDLTDPRYPAPPGKSPSAATIRVPGKLIASWADEGNPWHFQRKNQKEKDRVLAQEVCLTFEVPGDLELLVSEPGHQPYTISVAPQSVNGERRAELRLANLPEEDILAEACPPVLPMTDHHFQAYYDMSRSIGALERAHLHREYGGKPAVSEPHKHRLTLRYQGKAICPSGVTGSNCPPSGWENSYP